MNKYLLALILSLVGTGGISLAVEVDAHVGDGTRILPEGIIVTREGTRRNFDAGLRLSLEGKVVEGKGGYRSPSDTKSQDTGRKLEGDRDDKNRTPANPDRKTDSDRDKNR